MACNLIPCNSSVLQSKLEFPKRSFNVTSAVSSPSLPLTSSVTTTTTTTTTKINWDNVFRICRRSDVGLQDSSYLDGFLQRIESANRGHDKISEFIPFVVEAKVVGYIHRDFMDYLRKFKDVFVFAQDNYFGTYVTLCPWLESPEVRTEAVGYAVKCLGEDVIPGVRNEMYPVIPSYGKPLCFSLERAAAPYFGIKTYGVIVNGYVEMDGEKFMWLGKRNEEKSTYPGMLDLLVGGGIPLGTTCKENLLKECEEEAGIQKSIAKDAVPVGAISYMDIEGYRFKRDVLFCNDLKLSDSFLPYNQDGEVESFKLMPMNHVESIIRRTDFFKPCINVVIIDFLFRHGFIRPEQRGYLGLLQSLKNGDFS